MNYLKDEGYVIKRTDHSEADKYITILTKNNGVIVTLAKGVRKLTSRRSGNLELLNRISFQAVSKNANARYVLTDVTLIESHTQLKNTLSHLRTLFTFCELISVLCPQNEKQEEVFFLLDETLSEMREKELEFILQSFQIKLLSRLGYWDARHTFIDADDVSAFTQQIMEKRLRSQEYFKLP